ncbi:MAG TPA: hypothetical protein VH008_26855 [Pseudonocardia sp.]|jgi:D-arabinose 1-dehydrogenase-like Zn-dependent alcohol dehydrogenase|nr:hypothetical protein [Pseudonocardia sp.]
MSVQTYRSVQVAEPGAPLTVVDLPLRDPGAGQVRVKVQGSACRRGDFVHCAQGWVTGAAYPGGYAEMIIAPQTALARIPDGLSAADAAPMACAGVTMFNSIRRTAAGPGDVVAILGLCGLGHLGVQFAANFAALQGIRAMVEPLPLEKAAEGYDRMMANQARFRVVLTTD